MTNKEKLEIIDRKLDELYNILRDGTVFVENTQAIYNLEKIKSLLENKIEFVEESQERIDENLPPFIEETIEELVDDVYVCPTCKKEAYIYGDMVGGKCLKCNQKLVKKEH